MNFVRVLEVSIHSMKKQDKLSHEIETKVIENSPHQTVWTLDPVLHTAHHYHCCRKSFVLSKSTPYSPHLLSFLLPTTLHRIFLTITLLGQQDYFLTFVLFSQVVSIFFMMSLHPLLTSFEVSHNLI